MQWRPVENFPNANVDWLRTRYVSLILRQYFWLLFVQFNKAYIWRRRSKIKANILLLCLVGREIQLIRMNKGNLWFIGVANIRSPRCEHFTNYTARGNTNRMLMSCGRSCETCHSPSGKVSNKNYLVYKQIYYTTRTVYRLRYFSEVSWAQKTANEWETKVKYGVDRYAVVWTGFEGNHAIKLGLAGSKASYLSD